MTPIEPYNQKEKNTQYTKIHVHKTQWQCFHFIAANSAEYAVFVSLVFPCFQSSIDLDRQVYHVEVIYWETFLFNNGWK